MAAVEQRQAMFSKAAAKQGGAPRGTAKELRRFEKHGNGMDGPGYASRWNGKVKSRRAQVREGKA